jgi:hypothetical protein
MNFIKNKKYYFIVGIVCALVFFTIGYKATPEKVRIEIKEKVIEKHYEATVQKQEINIDQLLKQIKETAKSVDKTVIKEIVTQKDGTKIEKETQVSHSDQSSKTSTEQQTHVAELNELKKLIQNSKVVEKTQIVEKLRVPKWTIGAQVGLGVNSNSYIPGIPGNMVIGAFAEKQLIGPFSGGLWINSRLDGGLQLSVRF